MSPPRAGLPLDEDAARQELDDTADQLRQAVTAAYRRVWETAAIYVSLGLLLFLLIEFTRNWTDANYNALRHLPELHPHIHYLLRGGAIDIANLFVVNTALLGVVAAINIGIAVMPTPDPVATLNRSSLQTRARTIVWNKSLGVASYWCALGCMAVAALAWMSDRLPKIWLSATALTVIALIAVTVAANVGALADDEAQRLLDLDSAKKLRTRLHKGFEEKLAAWHKTWDSDLDKGPGRTVRWLAIGLGFFVLNFVIGLLAALIQVGRTRVFAAPPGAWWVLLLYTVADSLLGAYLAGAIYAVNRSNFRARLRRSPGSASTAKSPQKASMGRFMPMLRSVALVGLDGGLIVLCVWAGVRTHELAAGILLALAWVGLPQLLCTWSRWRGGGPLGYFFRRVVTATKNEVDRLTDRIASMEREFLPVSQGAGPGGPASSALGWPMALDGRPSS